jgi:hypothetical protein
LFEGGSNTPPSIIKRPGLALLASTPALPTGVGQGLTSWNNYIIAANSNSIYAIAGGLSSNLGSIIGTSVPLSFTQTANDQYLALHNGANLYTISSTGMTVYQPLSSSVVHDVVMTNYGNGYVGTPSVTFSAPPAGVTATGHAIMFNGTVSSVVLDNPGSGYTATPTVTIPAPTGTFTTATGTMHYTFPSYGGYMTSITIDNGGGPYLIPPVISFGGTSGCAAYAVLTNNTVTSAVVTNSGNGLSLPTSMTFSSPIQGNASATAVMNNTISGPFAYGIEYLDGYVFIMATNGRIYASNYENPNIWDALNYVTAESDPDAGVALVRHLNYLIAFGQWSTDFFYNAGNATGSPLAVNKQAKLEFGCANGSSVAKAEQTVLWVSNSQTQGRNVYMMNGLSPQKISTRYIDKYLNRDAMVNVRSYCMKTAGHTLYVLTLEDSNITFVYDLDEQVWYQWTSQSGGTESYFKFVYFTGNVEYAAGLYLQHESDGHVYIMGPDYYDDGANKIYFRSVSKPLDSGTQKRKFFTSAEVVGDKVSGNLSIRHSDDDYATWSPYRVVDMSKSRPIIYQGGSARRRAYEVFSSDSVPIRLEALELNFDVGEQGGGQEG